MKKTIFILFILFVNINVFAQQQQQQRRRNLNAPPVTSRAPTENDIEKRQRDIDERKAEYISNFMTTLEADDFQKEILKQYINNFYKEKVVLLKTKFNHSIERNKAIKNLEITHFKEVEELMSEEDILKLKDFVQGKFDDEEALKDKKKKKKKRKKKKKKDDNR
ncbi:hypothetical protein [Winogradskyella sp. UBA3174]|uniref:hypothetical protein n=1 Tax=Winogradskyella sp. UBA3174 TaxID=1947785 RepID=UPI0025D0435E|nr:hypothetical protein [Winogradskyella sp. UBA3174]|tara:strand:+ start:1793 stop:2284 length:492 start_codon:yes stop_codon:yes gene_type:complete